MQNPQNRDLMKDLYRWFEVYEAPPVRPSEEEMTRFFQKAWFDLDEIIQKHPGPWSLKLAIGFYEALENAYKEAQKGETNNDSSKGC